MSRRTTANNWEVVSRDDDGAFVNIDFDCPHCRCSTGVLILVGASNVDSLDGSWETDQVCPICDKDVVIECY